MDYGEELTPLLALGWVRVLGVVRDSVLACCLTQWNDVSPPTPTSVVGIIDELGAQGQLGIILSLL